MKDTLDPRLARIAKGRTDLIVEWVRDRLPSQWPEVDGASLLQWAAYYGDVTALRLLRDRGADLSSLGADLGLSTAAFHGHWQQCEFLLECGAPVGWSDPITGETALHAALTSHEHERVNRVVKVLLQAGADESASTLPGAPTATLMRDCRTRGESPLHRAAAFGAPSTIELLLQAGASAAQLDASGDSPLGWASWHRRPADVLRLLLHGKHWIHPDYRTMRENLLGDPMSPEHA